MARSLGATHALDSWSRTGTRRRTHSTNYVVNLSEAADAIAGIVMEYGDEVSGSVESAITQGANFAQSMVSRRSPRGSGDGGRLGHYADGWEIEIEQGFGTLSAVIYQANKPTLAHLLEDGHAKRGGNGRVSGIPHIKPTQEATNSFILRELKTRIEAL